MKALASECDCLLSIVPPRDAYRTAERIAEALDLTPNSRSKPLYYVDLNATSPRSARSTASLFERNPNIVFIDGGIIGGPPHPTNGTSTDSSDSAAPDWYCPGLIVSGPDEFPDASLAKILNFDHMSDTIGVATGVKMCFAATTKGFISLAIQSFTTAHQLNALPVLRAYLEKHNPSTLKLMERGLTTMPPKAYRWVHEMFEIGDTMEEDGNFQRDLFYGVGEVYRAVAEDSELGVEKPGKRIRGESVEDVVGVLSEGLQAKRRKRTS